MFFVLIWVLFSWMSIFRQLEELKPNQNKETIVRIVLLCFRIKILHQFFTRCDLLPNMFAFCFVKRAWSNKFQNQF